MQACSPTAAGRYPRGHSLVSPAFELLGKPGLRLRLYPNGATASPVLDAGTLAFEAPRGTCVRRGELAVGEVPGSGKVVWCK